MKNTLFIYIYSSLESYEQNKKIAVPCESLITLSIYKFCMPEKVKLILVPVQNIADYEFVLTLKDEVTFTVSEEIPWPAASCVFPVVVFEDFIITGLCAVARHLCKFRTTTNNLQEHEEGLLGFRHSCLQAPNETSVWTKFCEIDMLKTLKEVLTSKHLESVPVNVIRYENHLNKPAKVHNIYKVARDLNKVTLNDNSCDHTDKELSSPVNKSYNSHTRVCKNRKWKSNMKKEVQNFTTNTEELNIKHEFAEGPFLTLADLILLPIFHVIIKYFRDNIFESLCPLIYKWYITVSDIIDDQNVFKLLSSLSIDTCETQHIIVPITEDVSLYKSDPKRHNPKKRLFTKEDDIEAALTTVVEGMELSITENDFYYEINWQDVPAAANPTADHLPDKRKARKTQQLENLSLAVCSIVKSGDLIIDFCSGSGHLGILIAYLKPDCTVILLENKEQSLLRAKTRIQEMDLKNVYFFQCNIDFFIGKFDVGIALHACGIATDLVLDKCLKANAKFVICPCCYGSLHVTDRLIYPRSDKFSAVCVDKYMCIGHAADQTHKDHPLTVRGARCMEVIDSDRGRLAEEFGYKVTLSKLKPSSCTPKNNLLIGHPG